MRMQAMEIGRLKACPTKAKVLPARVGQAFSLPMVVLCFSGICLHAASRPECETFRHHGQLSEAAACYQKLANDASPAMRAEGLWGLGDLKAANNEFRVAVGARPKDAMLRVRWGRLMIEGNNKEEAAKLFDEAMEIEEDFPPALLGMAIVASDSYEVKAVELAEKALKKDPKLTEAQELLAKLALEDGNEKKAIEEADKALKLSPEALDAMAVRASIDLLHDRTNSEWFDRIYKINPLYGEANAIAAHFFIINRRYEEGIVQLRKAIQLDPRNQEARAELGVNLMRLGKEVEAKLLLEECWEASYRPALVANTLKLMDSYKRFTTYKTPTTILRLQNKEADLLKLYFEPELKKAMAVYEKKYKIKLTEPVQLEVYPDHEDFAVRTMGLPGLGALGVTFGNVVAMDSPSGRKPGSFHWASTLWHELSHVYVLSATKHRVPRWFTEGMAVHEETAASPDWGDRLDPYAIGAIKNKKLLPIATLDRGFVRPEYPQQVIVSYFQAGRICDYISEKWGDQKLLDMMNAFGEKKETVQVVEEQLGVKPEEFDMQFLAWLDAQTKKTVEGFDKWRERLKNVAANAKAKKWDEVIKEGKEIRDIYPDYVEAGSVYEFLADAFLEKKDRVAATHELSLYSKIGGRSPLLIKKLATLLEEQGRNKEAAAALDRLNYIYPVNDEDLHRQLGGLWFDQGNLDGAIREFSAVVAMKPQDPATAYFQLAKALNAAKRIDEARDNLVLSLEAAPGYKPAQKLLLELTKN
jgi:tetratricopeptide (TPR) repeat protein